MKEKVTNLVNEKLSKLNMYVDDAFISEEEGKKIFNIVLDSDEVIDLNRITDASRMINKIIDQNERILEDSDELDTTQKEVSEDA